MAHTSEMNTAHSGLFENLKTVVSGLQARHARYRQYRATVNELRSLSDRELSDLGLHRSIIFDVARHAVYDQ
ncbi:DUF1127 domain-containing protein [Parasulfitobacter algicola]|uniref:DUF1127 domain-containing protein n=1 Tax=Parasulfitobacter algicola TaxID=2614809 RepID=A0ABX2IV67_9RHOB|nr:DUF1127 domain-containing protein [Sulfitobacter algicola]NSX54727.1 DUF1127 domain-containing protein [Sulfitobacter algicola]